MQKIVFGIIAVFFAQIAFQIFVDVDQTNEEFAALERFETPSQRSSNIANVDELFAGSTLIEAETPSLRQVRRDPSNLRPEIVRAGYRVATKPRPALHPREFFPAVIITPPSRDPVEQRSLSAAYIEKRPGKSVPAKAFSVIKKPYSWMRSAISKLL